MISLESNCSPTLPVWWKKIELRLIEVFGRVVYENWLSHLHPFINRGHIALAVPTAFIRDWIYQHYISALKNAIEEEKHPLCKGDINILVNKTHIKKAYKDSFTFDNFVIDKTNRFAYLAFKEMAKVGSSTLPLLFVYSEPGLGKTHLMHALRNSFDRANILYATAESFLCEFIDAVKKNNSLEFKDKFRSVDVLLLDDMQFFAGKTSSQRELFHTLSSLISNNKSIVVAANNMPDNLKNLDSPIRSRLSSGMVINILPTSFDLRLKILQNKTAEMNLDLEEAAIDFIACSFESGVRELEGALLNLNIYAQTYNKSSLSLANVKEILQSRVIAKNTVSLECIKKVVAKYYKLSPYDLSSSSRKRFIVKARQIAMFFARKATTSSLSNIGNVFGNKTHVSVINAFRNIESSMMRDSGIKQDVLAIETLLYT